MKNDIIDFNEVNIKVKTIILKCLQSRSTTLNLSEQNIVQLPKEIGTLTHLTELDLHNNKLSNLPIEIGKLTNLQKLNLGENYLETLPPEIGELRKLIKLILEHNLLETLPPEIGNLVQLKTLNLRNNSKLISLPPEIGLLSDLQILDLSRNEMDALPLEITRLRNLRHLDMSNNHLRHVSPTIGSLSELQELDLHDNQIEYLPPEIGKLINLERFNLETNQLRNIPEEIVKLKKLRPKNNKSWEKGLNIANNKFGFDHSIYNDDSPKLIAYTLAHQTKYEQKDISEYASVVNVKKLKQSRSFAMIKRVLEYWWCLFFIIPAVLLFYGIDAFFDDQRLDSVGISAKAEVLAVNYTHVKINEKDQANIRVKVMPREKPSYLASFTAVVESYPNIGTIITVKIDPEDSSNMILSNEQIQNMNKGEWQYFEALDLIESNEFNLAITNLKQAAELLEPQSKRLPLAFYNLACCYAVLNQKEEALHWLEKAIGKGFDDYRTMKDDPDLDNIRDTDRFVQLMKKYR